MHRERRGGAKGEGARAVLLHVQLPQCRRERALQTGRRTAPSISISSVMRVRTCVDDSAATEATPLALSNAECVERAARPRISRISKFVNFHAICVLLVHIVKRIEGLGI